MHTYLLLLMSQLQLWTLNNITSTFLTLLYVNFFVRFFKSLNCNVLEKYSNAQYAKTHHGLSLCYMLSCERERERGRTLLSRLTAHCYAHVNSSRCYSKCNKSGLLARRRFQFDSNSQRDGYTARSSLSRLMKYYLLALQIGGEFEISYRVVSQK